jgi:hypothetical protein
MRHLYSVAMWPPRRPRLTHIRAPLHPLVQVFCHRRRRRRRPVRCPQWSLALTAVLDRRCSNNRTLALPHRFPRARPGSRLRQGVLPRFWAVSLLLCPRHVLPHKDLLPPSTVSYIALETSSIKLKNCHSSW